MQKEYRARRNNHFAHSIMSLPFPVTVNMHCCLVLYWDQDLVPQAIEGYLAAVVQNTHISLGFPDPCDRSSFPMLKCVQTGIKNVFIHQLAHPPLYVLQCC